MDKRYSDSLFPIGIGASFLLTLVIVLAAGTIVGLIIENKYGNMQRFGIVPMIIVLLIFLGGPIVYNKKKSRFEKGKQVLEKLDRIGMIQGLRGAFFRILVYEQGMEIRAFYHRYYIPFEKIDCISVQKGKVYAKLNILTDIEGAPNYIYSDGKEFLKLTSFIEELYRQNTDRLRA